LASGLWNTSFQFGAALGLAVATALSVAGAGGGQLAGYHNALVLPVAATATALLIMVTGLRGRRSS
jgi:hypothetical protein